ncbi:RHS repeat-associated core domain-containing protein, partial [Pseudomonas sp. Root562]|uniref:RHS repeat-associated core domain-containing protein n=1 Tax=Pseudomonas sp. Root562 TaxID=1736561 RepID=UPI000A404106
IISQERYYPFGGTAWANGAAVQVSYKTVRYSGKERDATGLYYYGFRYYVAWWQRWLNPDPAGVIDGLSFYGFCGNNPISRIDPDGHMWQEPDSISMSSALEQFLDNEQSLRASYRLPQSDDDESMDSQDSTVSSQSQDSPGESSPGSPGSPDNPAPPTEDQNIILDLLNRNAPEHRYDWNNRNLLLRDNFGAKVYRADRRNPEDVLRDGFNPSDEFTAVKKMIGGSALIVAEALEGALFYAAQSGHRYYFYEIDAKDVSGVSLLENLVFNNSNMVAHLDAYPDVSPSNQTGEANKMHEVHLSHDDLTRLRSPIVSLGEMKEKLNLVRRTMNL